MQSTHEEVKEAHSNSNKKQKESISPSFFPSAKKHGGLLTEEESHEASDRDIS